MSRRALVPAAAIALVVLVAYGGSLDGAFVSDDIQALRDNPLVATLSAANVRAIFTTFDASNYAPVKVLSFAVDRQIWGTSPFGYHVTNVLLHLGCALLVYAILLRLGLAPLAALLCAALWAVHPLQVESVAWIAERKNVLSGLFFFAAFLVYLEYSDRPAAGAYVAMIVLYVLAMLTKMNTMVLPAICLAYEALFRHRRRWRDVGAAALPFALAALVAWYNLAGNPIHGDVWHGGSPIVTWLSSAIVIFRYLRRMVLPVGLEPLYDVRLRGSPLDPPVAAALLGLAALALVTGWLMRRRRREAFWIWWFALALAPMLNVVVPFRSMMNDRYMYLPLVGPLAMIAFWLAEARRDAVRRVGAGVAVALVLVCVVLSRRQVEVWSDTISVWGATASRRPVPGGDPVYRRPDFDARVAYVQQALARAPSSSALHNNLGELYYEAGRLQDALGELETAHRLTPDDPIVLLDLGRVYMRVGRAPEAEEPLTRAAELRPYDFLPWLNLTRLHLVLDRDPRKVRAALDAALRVEPDAFASLRPEREALARLETAGTAPAR